MREILQRQALEETKAIFPTLKQKISDAVVKLEHLLVRLPSSYFYIFLQTRLLGNRYAGISVVPVSAIRFHPISTI